MLNWIDRVYCWWVGHIWGSWMDFDSHELRVCFNCGLQQERRSDIPSP